MQKPRVYFTDLRTKPGKNLLDKFEKLVMAAGIDSIDFNKKLTAVKTHFGEPGNMGYLRANWAGRLVSLLRKQGAIPFLTDTCTLYHGRRSNAPDHLEAAYENGYHPSATGCQVIIADGIRGTDYREIKTGFELCPVAKIGSSIAEAEVLISLSHFKGHEMMGFGGTLKNLGMGCAAVGGKLEMHSNSTPEIISENCTGCGICEENCAHDAIKVGSNRIAVIDESICVGCGQCIAVCQFDAARVVWDSASEISSRKVAEYATATVSGKPAFHISFMIDITPDCDCWDYSDKPVVGDIGIAASFDPVALDQACADMVIQSPVNRGSRLDNQKANDDNRDDIFRMLHPRSDWTVALSHAESCGLGSRKYDLEIIK